MALPCSDLSLLSLHGKFSSLQFLLRGETKTTSQICFADYSMSCKAVGWIFSTDKKVFLHDFHFCDMTVNWGIAPGTVPYMGNKHGKCYEPTAALRFG